MHNAHLAPIFVLLSHVAASMILQFPQEDSIPNARTVTNVTLPAHKFSTPSNVLQFHCDGSRYGQNLNVASCRDIFSFMNKNDTQAVFSERHSGHYADIPLPFRILGTDGRCFVQPMLAVGATSGHASATEIGRAAYTLFQRCVMERGVGGIVSTLGGNSENMVVVVSDYEPHVRCDRTARKGPPWESCLHILADMKAAQNVQVFGSPADPRVEVRLPWAFRAIDARCMIRVGIQGKSTTSSWYEVWEAVTALVAICVRAEKGGKVYRIGLRKNIFVEIMDDYPDLVRPMVNGAGGSNVTLER